MSRFFSHRATLGSVLALVVLGLSACDGLTTDATADAEFEALMNGVAADASLTATQQSQLAKSGGDMRTPGRTWILADSLSRRLTAEQKAQLIARAAARDTARFRGLLGHPGAGYLGLGGFIGSHKHFGVSRADSVLNLTEAQKTQIQALHTAYRDAAKALRDSRRAGTITAEAFLRQLAALNAKLHADVEAVLTTEQKAALAAFRAQKEAAFAAYKAQVTAVRDRVLGLDADRSARFDAIITAQLTAREVLVEQFQAGTITLAQFQAQVMVLNETRLTSLNDLLDDRQFEIVQLHDAITARVHGHGFGHGPGVGDKGPGGHGRGRRG